MSRRLGYEPMPWQVDMFDTLYELDDEGNLFYSKAVITVPRQSAKTTSTLIRVVHRLTRSEALGWGTRPVAAYTAQTAQDARAKMTEEWMPILEGSDMASEVKQYVLSNGKEQIKFHGGGRVRTFAPNATGAHGSTLDLVDIDEAFAYTDSRVETGAGPAMITRVSPQIVIQSTAGTLDSTYLREKVDNGRERVESGDSGGVYYLEYSAGPDDDLDNPEHWHRWMPALGHTIRLEAIQREHDTLTEDEFARAYGNVWTGSLAQIIPAKSWAEAFALKTKRDGRAWMAVDAAPGLSGQGRSASIAVASYRGAEIHVDVIHHDLGLSWVADKLYELTRTHRVEALYVDATGPIGSVLPDIKASSAANVVVTETQEMVNACARFHQAVIDRTARHHGQDVLNAAVAGAAKRTLGDGWAFKRASSTSDISPLVACTLAHWAACLNPKRGPIRMYTNPKAKI